MGLDAYINSYPAGTAFDEVGRFTQSTNGEGSEPEEIGYFRKVNWLHHWMQMLYAYRTRIIDPNDFNCVHVVLSKEDLLTLRQDIKNDNISPTTGFFFGSQSMEQWQKDKVVETVIKAIDAVDCGKVVTYSSWW